MADLRDSTKIKRAVKAAIPDAKAVRAYQRRGSSFWHISLTVSRPVDCRCSDRVNNWQLCHTCRLFSNELTSKGEKAATESGAFYSHFYLDDGCQHQSNSIIIDIHYSEAIDTPAPIKE